jgi:hypothetical protein
MFDFDFPQYTPKTNVPELRRAPEKEQPKAKDLPFDLKAMKLALKMRETGGKMNSKNRQTGASGSYQYLPSTAIGLIKQAKREGYDVPYNGRMTKADVSYALRTNKNLNEWLSDYDLSRKAKMFDYNEELIAAGHYMNSDRLMKIIKTRYPGKGDLSDVNIAELSRRKVRNGLLENRTDGNPSVIEYSECVSNIYKQIVSGQIAMN